MTHLLPSNAICPLLVSHRGQTTLLSDESFFLYQWCSECTSSDLSIFVVSKQLISLLNNFRNKNVREYGPPGCHCEERCWKSKQQRQLPEMSIVSCDWWYKRTSLVVLLPVTRCHNLSYQSYTEEGFIFEPYLPNSHSWDLTTRVAWQALHGIMFSSLLSPVRSISDFTECNISYITHWLCRWCCCWQVVLAHSTHWPEVSRKPGSNCAFHFHFWNGFSWLKLKISFSPPFFTVPEYGILTSLAWSLDRNWLLFPTITRWWNSNVGLKLWIVVVFCVTSMLTIAKQVGTLQAKSHFAL
jgi:hypothetical protein